MDEGTALDRLAGMLPAAGDDCAVVGDLVVTTDMLHAATDFPEGTTHYTAGWRAVGASLSDVAAMGAAADAAVAVYGSPEFDADELQAVVEGACDVCETVGAHYVGGDLDRTEELTLATTAIGRTDDPIWRSGATVGDAVCVTGTLGRSAAALQFFERDETERANELFRFDPRVQAGQVLADYATAMIDSSDGLARSVHQLADASDCGFTLETPLPIDETVAAVTEDDEERRRMGLFFGEDFELVCTIPEFTLDAVRSALPCQLSRIGTVVDSGVTLEDDPLPDRGYTH